MVVNCLGRRNASSKGGGSCPSSDHDRHGDDESSPSEIELCDGRKGPKEEDCYADIPCRDDTHLLLGTKIVIQYFL